MKFHGYNEDKQAVYLTRIAHHWEKPYLLKQQDVRKFVFVWTKELFQNLVPKLLDENNYFFQNVIIQIPTSLILSNEFKYIINYEIM